VAENPRRRLFETRLLLTCKDSNPSAAYRHIGVGGRERQPCQREHLDVGFGVPDRKAERQVTAGRAELRRQGQEPRGLGDTRGLRRTAWSVHSLPVA